MKVIPKLPNLDSQRRDTLTRFKLKSSQLHVLLQTKKKRSDASYLAYAQVFSPKFTTIVIWNAYKQI